jgi:hypothetical protein
MKFLIISLQLLPSSRTYLGSGFPSIPRSEDDCIFATKSYFFLLPISFHQSGVTYDRCELILPILRSPMIKSLSQQESIPLFLGFCKSEPPFSRLDGLVTPDTQDISKGIWLSATGTDEDIPSNLRSLKLCMSPLSSFTRFDEAFHRTIAFLLVSCGIPWGQAR